VAFVWDNFGPLHADRCDAVARALGDRGSVIGVELFSRSETYDWTPASGASFEKVTLFERKGVSTLSVARAVVDAIRRRGCRHVFLCHYQEPYIALAALLLRMLGKRVYFLGDSKFDDYPRRLWREVLKSFYLLPYQGALCGTPRSRDYLRFLGFRSPIELGYDAVDLSRIRRQADAPAAPDGTPFIERHFVHVARLVPKKNTKVLIEAMGVLLSSGRLSRVLRILGAGPEEEDLRRRIRELGLEEWVRFEGFVQTSAVSAALSRSLCIILPSTGEQFGQVVAEALAMGVPAIVSPTVGARDELVRSGVNGFVVEPDNADGLAYFMHLLSSDQELWTAMSASTERYRKLADTARFSASALALMGYGRSSGTDQSPARPRQSHNDVEVQEP
jgi:glycosyltransferase involved in cell wall biosynthesis